MTVDSHNHTDPIDGQRSLTVILGESGSVEITIRTNGQSRYGPKMLR